MENRQQLWAAVPWPGPSAPARGALMGGGAETPEEVGEAPCRDQGQLPAASSELWLPLLSSECGGRSHLTALF